MGQDWQTLSAAMYLYAAKCVEDKYTPFFDEMQHNQQPSKNVNHVIIHQTDITYLDLHPTPLDIKKIINQR